MVTAPSAVRSQVSTLQATTAALQSQVNRHDVAALKTAYTLVSLFGSATNELDSKVIKVAQVPRRKRSASRQRDPSNHAIAQIPRRPPTLTRAH